MARSKKVDETGQSNDNRSIRIEKEGQLDEPGFEPDWDFTQGTYDQVYDYEPEEVKSEGKTRLTHKIEIPEHIRKMMGL